MSPKILTKCQAKDQSKTHWLQKPPVKIMIALLGLVLVLIVMTMNIAKYENHLAHGDTVLLALAPVDPRGFMQGDYMTLNYALENEVFAALSHNRNHDYTNQEGYIIVALDSHNVGQFVRLTDTNQPHNLANDEMAIYYRIRNDIMHLATNAFFFQEGQGKSFEAAKYGLFRVNDKGEPLLTDMVDKNFKIIAGKAVEAAAIKNEEEPIAVPLE